VTTLKHISSSNPIKNDIKCNAQEKDADSLDAVINFLRETSFGYHSFFPSHQRSFRVIIKNLHHLKPTYDISEALVTLGHTVTSLKYFKAQRCFTTILRGSKTRRKQ